MRAILLALLLCSPAAAVELTPGCVLVSRNKNDAENTSLGHWNHLAVAVSATELVESQAGIGVQKISLADYLKRDYEPVKVLAPCSAEAGQRAAQRAASLVGLKFRKLSSLFRRQGEMRQKRGLNCVSVAKWAYWDEDRRVRRIKIPDNVLRLEGLFDTPQPLGTPVKAEEIPPPKKSGERSLLKGVPV